MTPGVFIGDAFGGFIAAEPPPMIIRLPELDLSLRFFPLPDGLSFLALLLLRPSAGGIDYVFLSSILLGELLSFNISSISIFSVSFMLLFQYTFGGD